MKGNLIKSNEIERMIKLLKSKKCKTDIKLSNCEMKIDLPWTVRISFTVRSYGLACYHLKQRRNKGKAKEKQRKNKVKGKEKQRKSKGKTKGKQRKNKGKTKEKERKNKGKGKEKQIECTLLCLYDMQNMI
jgi:hypothetical protein